MLVFRYFQQNLKTVGQIRVVDLMLLVLRKSIANNNDSETVC